MIKLYANERLNITHQFVLDYNNNNIIHLYGFKKITINNDFIDYRK